MKILFITAGDITIASSRMRAFWVADELRKLGHEVNCVPHARLAKGFINTFPDVWIWQKVINTEWIATTGGRHYYDACDPSWWWEPEFVRAAIGEMSGVVFSNNELEHDFINWQMGNAWNRLDDAYKFCHHIPDRLNLSHFPKQRQHTSVDPVRFIWFGLSVNRIALIGALANLERLAANGHNIELTIMDNAPHEPVQWTNYFPIYHVPWSLETENEILASHDIAVLPPYPGPWGQVKSNNKQLVAWASGLAVTDGMNYCDMVPLVKDWKERQFITAAGLLNDYTVEKSAQEWAQLLSEGR